MSRNQLPEGVGKKIVEALKRQSEIEINPIADDETIIDTNSTQAEDNLELFEDVISDEVNAFTPELEIKDSFVLEEPTQDLAHFSFDYEETAQKSEPIAITPQVHYTLPEEPRMQPNFEKGKSFDIPANVAVLKRLITQLPSGVTKQTGAQIIRQTIEALGISMNNVLQEAQQVQDNLNDSIKDCMSKVQEYKTNIMHLERHAQDYQKQVSQLNDLISLFVLTDKTK